MKTKLITITKNINRLVFKDPGIHVVFFKNISGTIACEIQSENVQLYMFGLYDLDNVDNFKIYTEQIHKAPNSFSELLILSVLKGHASLAFTGSIRIEKDAQKSHAYQKNQNLTLSKDAFIDSRPILEILADDVFCTHGSTSGPLSEEQLLYLQMRGVDSVSARKLLIDGFKQQIYNRITKLGITV